jgi:hypothetical protein
MRTVFVRLCVLFAVAALIVFVGVTAAAQAPAPSAPAGAAIATATLRADTPGPVVNRNIYGHFSEHLGRCIYEGYWVGEDGTNKFFEVIMVDRAHPAIMSDSTYAAIAAQRGRAFRGLTAAGRKGRGMRRRGQHEQWDTGATSRA